MKKVFRPHCGGYILLYALVTLSVADAVYTFVRQMTGTLNEIMGSFSLFSYLIAAAAVAYVRVYAKSRVAIEGDELRIVWPASIKPGPNARRASFIFRQGDLDLHLIDKTIRLSSIRRYGYAQDLGFERVDRSGGKPDAKLFPVNEVVFLTDERKRYHLNIAVYSEKQRREILEAVHAATGLTAHGALADAAPGLVSTVDYDDFVFDPPKREPEETVPASNEVQPETPAAPARPPRDDDVI